MKNIASTLVLSTVFILGNTVAQNLVFSFSVVDMGSTSVVKIYVQNPSASAENLLGFGSYFYFDNAETTLTSWSTAPLVALGWAPDQTNNYVPGTNPTVTIQHTGRSEFNVIDNNLVGSSIPANSAQILVAEINFNHTVGTPTGGFGYLAATVANGHPPLKYFNASTQYNVVVNAPAAQPLPVELIHFDAKSLETTIELSWAAASETNFWGYELQRSTNGRDFFKIDWIEGAGGGNYRRTDGDVRDGITYYYRLNMLDNDGNLAFSAVRSAELDGEGTAKGMTISPNPARRYFKLEFETEQFGKASLEMVNSSGQVVYNQHLELNEGPNAILVAVAHLPEGTYLARLKTVDREFMEKVVIGQE